MVGDAIFDVDEQSQEAAVPMRIQCNPLIFFCAYPRWIHGTVRQTPHCDRTARLQYVHIAVTVLSL